MPMSISDLLSELIYTIPAVFIAIILHEWAHGFVSYKLGDPTPKLEGTPIFKSFKTY